MLNKRQEEILKVIVEEYIKTVRPVSSSSLCDRFNCSSATIRNEMMVLEENEFIEKTPPDNWLCKAKYELYSATFEFKLNSILNESTSIKFWTVIGIEL